MVFRINKLSKISNPADSQKNLEKKISDHKRYFKNCNLKTVYWERALDLLPNQKVGGKEDRLPEPDLPLPF